jgi:hypothetical protein
MSEFHDERSDRFIPKVPKGLEDLGQRLESTMWINRQLRLLEREKSSFVVVSSLRSELTAMLTTLDFLPYPALLERVNTLTQENLRLESEVLRAQTELNERPIREIVKVVQQSETIQGSSIEMPLVQGSWITKNLGKIIIGLIIIGILVKHFLF